MSWTDLIYFLLGGLLCFGAKGCGRGEWNEEYASREQTGALRGLTALLIALHHMAQKTCAPWHPARYTVHGLDVFVPMGYLFTGVFLFCSGLGLYRSLRSRADYLRGFLRRRILPIAAAFCLSEWIYTGVRLLMGERMDLLRALWYLSGLHMANFNAWYVVVIPFFYLAFWLAFRFCKREGLAIAAVFAFTLAYAALCASIDHQNDWWIQGEWWYNSILMFPAGLLFGKHEQRVTRFFRRGYWFWLVFTLAGAVALFQGSEYLIGHVWGYYRFGRMKVIFRLLSAGTQWLACAGYMACCLLLMMKIRIGNRLLRWMGGLTLEFYLMHGMFVELFGYNFKDIGPSLYYIKNVPLYVAAVLACSVPAALLFHLAHRWLLLRLRCSPAGRGTGEGEKAKKRLFHREREAAPPAGGRRPGALRAGLGRWFFPVLLALTALGFLLAPGASSRRVFGGMILTPPEGYRQQFTDARYVVWEYAGQDGKPGKLVLDEDIRGSYAQKFSTVDEVLADCDWMREAEPYLNPQGVRMARGFCLTADGYPERRYYVETDKAVFLLCMIEDSRYYDPEDCERVMLETANSIRRKP